LLAALCLTSLPLLGEAPREVRAVRTPRPPVIDGSVGDEVWSLAPEISGFRQQRPDNGEPSSEPVSVRVLFDDHAIYVGAVMTHETQPIVRLLGRRDTFLDSDWFGILLDSQFDRRSALCFFVNPDGVQLDEAVTDDVVEDFDWDGVWQSATQIEARRWTAELRIPLSLFRFTGKPEQEWGVNFIRWVRARQEQARLVAHPRDQRGFVSRFGTLKGLSGIERRHAVTVQPYTTSTAVSNDTVAEPDPLGTRRQTLLDAGADIRWTTPSGTSVIATLNPDFGQVEADPAILNLSEFELFHPEKRPFFVEGAKLFNFGSVATAYGSPHRVAHPLLFYSRRIGREPQLGASISGEYVEIPSSTRILGAAKLTARSEAGTTLAMIYAVTDDEHASTWRDGVTTEHLVQPGTHYFAGRLTRDFGDSARLGALLTSSLRQTEGLTSTLPESASAIGVDGYSYLLGGNMLVDWMVAGSRVAGDAAAMRALQTAPAHAYQRPDATHLELDPARTSLDGWGAKASLSRETGVWRYQVMLQSYSPGFDLNEAGFHPRSDLDAAHAQLTWFDVATRRYTRSNRLTLGRYASRNGGGDRLSDAVTLQYTTTLTNWWTATAMLSAAGDAIDDRETRGGPAIAKPAGWSNQLRLVSNTAKPLWLDLSRNDGRDDDGGSVDFTQLVVAWRPRSNVVAQIAASRSTNVVASKFFTAVADPAGLYGRRWLFGRLEEQRIEIGPRLDWTIRRNLTLQLYVRPQSSSGSYTAIGELERSKGNYSPYEHVSDEGAFYRIDTDGDGPRLPFVVANPDFTFQSLQGSAVLRWEVGPATVFAVWNEGRQQRRSDPTGAGLPDLGSAGEVPGEHRFLMKVSYRFELAPGGGRRRTTNMADGRPFRDPHRPGDQRRIVADRKELE
jgi:hypothetical protein